jgi:hypothetical protein
MIRSTVLAVSAVAVAGALLFSPVSQQSAQAQTLGGLKSSVDSSNLVTLVRRGGGGGRGGISRGGGGGRYAGNVGRYRGRYAGNVGRYHGRYAGNVGRYRGRYAGNVGRYYGGNRYYGNRYYGNRYYGYRRYGYWPWIGVGAGTYAYGSTNCNWLYHHNYRRWLAVCQ